MLDIGREIAEAIYFLQYILAQLLWTLNRALLSIAVIAEDVNVWITTNVAYFIDLLTNTLAGPMGALFILALTLLGVWYMMNNVLPTRRIVDPQKLILYGFMTFFFFATPTMVIDLIEGIRQAATVGVQQQVLDDAAGELFGTELGGTDTGLPAAIPDVYPAGDGVIGSFDLVAYFLSVGNVAELGNVEFPALFAATYFPFGDPSTINLTDEADREAARRLAAAGIERLVFALVAIPTAIADHFLRLALTGAAMLLYAGLPFAMMLAFFIYTESFLGAYIRQFINLFIETFLSVIIASIVIGLLAVAAQRGIGLYIGAAIIATVIIVWRIQGAFRLVLSGMNLFGGGMVTGGASGGDLVAMGRNAALLGAGAGLAGVAALAGGGALAAAGMLRASGGNGGQSLGLDPDKAEGRAGQLEALAGYTVGRSRVVRNAIETMHEVRTFGRNFRDGMQQVHEPDTLDYLRVGSSMSSFGSSPWVAMRLSPSLRQAYGQIGGYGRRGIGGQGSGYAEDRESEGAGVQGSGGAGVGMNVTTAGGQLPAASGQPAGISSQLPVVDEQSVEISGQLPVTGGQTAVTGGQAPVAGSRSAEIGGQPPAPQLFLSPLTAQQQAGLASVGANLHDADAGVTLRVLVEMVGEERAQALQTAVAEHGAEALQEVIDQIVAQTVAARAAGQGDETIFAAYQSGAALPASPLSAAQQTAAADLVLQPRRAVSKEQLLGEIASLVEAGGGSERDLAVQLGSVTHFGPQTGAIRSLLTGVNALQLTAAQLRDLAEAIQTGESVAAFLEHAGYRPGLGRAFARDLAGLGMGIVLPQTVAARDTRFPAAAEETAVPDVTRESSADREA